MSLRGKVKVWAREAKVRTTGREVSEALATIAMKKDIPQETARTPQPILPCKHLRKAKARAKEKVKGNTDPILVVPRDMVAKATEASRKPTSYST